jgi:rhombotail lipoprotein
MHSVYRLTVPGALRIDWAMHIPKIHARKLTCFLAAAGSVLLFTGCISRWNANRHQASSVVQFLYPGKDQPFIQPGIPTLRLPLRVAIAFVPSATSLPNGRSRSFETAFTEAQKNELMREVAVKFRTLPFVQSLNWCPRPTFGLAEVLKTLTRSAP